jgi:hypothetical protein
MTAFLSSSQWVSMSWAEKIRCVRDPRSGSSGPLQILSIAKQLKDIVKSSSFSVGVT